MYTRFCMSFLVSVLLATFSMHSFSTKNPCAAQDQKEKEDLLRRKAARIITNERNTTHERVNRAVQICSIGGIGAGVIGHYSRSLPLALAAGAAVIGLAASQKSDAEVLDHFMFAVKEQGKVDFYTSDEFLTITAIMDESKRVESRGGRLKLGR